MLVNLRNFIRDVHDFPKKGIVFKDISPLLGSPIVFANAIEQIHHKWDGKVDSIAALDARGFIFGAALAYSLRVPLVMLRKKGKLPGNTREKSYSLEYGTATLEVQENAFELGDRVLLVDDLLATGGTARAGCDLIEMSGAQVAGCAFIIELSALGGRDILAGREVQTLVNYEE